MEVYITHVKWFKLREPKNPYNWLNILPGDILSFKNLDNDTTEHKVIRRKFSYSKDDIVESLTIYVDDIE